MLLNINRASEKVSPFYVCDNLDVIQFWQFLAETYPQEI